VKGIKTNVLQHLKSVYIHFVPQVGQTFFLKVIPIQRSDRPEQARAHSGVVLEVVTAVVRAIRGTITVRVVEHPSRSLPLNPIPPHN